MAMDTLNVRVIIGNKFRRGNNTTQTAHTDSDVYEVNITDEHFTRNWSTFNLEILYRKLNHFIVRKLKSQQ